MEIGRHGTYVHECAEYVFYIESNDKDNSVRKCFFEAMVQTMLGGEGSGRMGFRDVPGREEESGEVSKSKPDGNVENIKCMEYMNDVKGVKGKPVVEMTRISINAGDARQRVMN